jgi:hypothetical protein
VISNIQGGQTFTYNAVSKSGVRPIVYSAIGSHANFAVPGTHTRVIAGLDVNDFTSAGTLWDPTLSAFYYTYSLANRSAPDTSGVFTPLDASTPPPAWLEFLVKWGDQQYPDSDPRQVNFLNANIQWKYSGGPTGPLDKDLNREGTCPGNATKCTTLTELPATSGSSIPVTVTRTSTSEVAVSTSTAASTTGVPSMSGSVGSSGATSTGMATTSASPVTAAAAGTVGEISMFGAGIGLVVAACML